MLRLFGPENTADYAHGRDLLRLIRALWTHAADDPGIRIDVISGVQCHGQKEREIDLLLLGRCGRPLPHRQSLPGGGTLDLHIRDLCLIIEVKNHPPEDVRFEGGRARVRYGRHWHDATRQSKDQKDSLVAYLRAHGVGAPFVINLIWLRNVPRAQLPRRPGNLVGADSDWHQILDVALDKCALGAPAAEGGAPVCSCFARLPAAALDACVRLFTAAIPASPMDRRKLEEVNRRILEGQRFDQRLGDQLLIFRGKGGTGKTVRLLRMARNLYTERSARCLLLTYNRALVSDLRRLLAIMRIGFSSGEPGIQVTSIYSFMRRIFDWLEVPIDRDADYFEHYPAYKAWAIRTLEALDAGEREELFGRMPRECSADHILVDEAQDWPADEKRILFQLYRPEQFILADGVDQFVRADEYIDWREGLPRDSYQVVGLRQSLRLKSGLTRVILEFAQRMGLGDYDLDPNDEITGGRVILFKGKFLGRFDHFKRIYDLHRERGNEPIDMLLCVPPSLCRANRAGRRHCHVSDVLRADHYELWDGWDPAVRGQSYPMNLNQMRLVQYDSCRGLEGWTVVCFNLDDFYRYKMQSHLERGAAPGDMFVSREQAAQLFAARWCMIPLTRAIDTLVLQVRDFDSPPGRALKACAEIYPEIVEVIES